MSEKRRPEKLPETISEGGITLAEAREDDRKENTTRHRLVRSLSQNVERKSYAAADAEDWRIGIVRSSQH